jgi:hypothetical protein
MSTIVNIPEVAVHDESAANTKPTEVVVETKQEVSSPPRATPSEEVAVDTPVASGQDDMPIDTANPDDEPAPVTLMEEEEVASEHDVDVAVIKDDEKENTEELPDLEEAAATTASETNTAKPDLMLSIEEDLAQLSLQDDKVKSQAPEPSNDLDKSHIKDVGEEKTLDTVLPEGEHSGEVSVAT